MDNTATKIKRVISDPEEQFARKSQRVHSPVPNTTGEVATYLDRTDDGNTPMDVDAPAVIEDENDDSNRPLTHIDKAVSKTSTTGSSLSDDRSHLERGTFSDEPKGSMIRNDSKLSTDSSASMLRSVENSSGNWGWFEDVHGTDGVGSESRRVRRSRSKGGLLNGYDDALSEGVHHGLDDPDSEAMAVTAPTYVLEESLSSQQLWRHTAGTRPPQPVEERAFFEQMWAQNFAQSQVDYQMPVEVLTATTPISLSPFADGMFGAGNAQVDYAIGPNHVTRQQHPRSRHEEVALMRRLHDPRQARNIGIRAIQPHHKQYIVNKKIRTGSDASMTVHVRGDNVFGTTVSKSFAKSKAKNAPLEGVDTVNISIASYRVVEVSRKTADGPCFWHQGWLSKNKKQGKYAQFLVIYREGSIRDTIGVWKRYSDFVELSRKVMEAHISCGTVLASMSPLSAAKETDVEHLPNAITSWRLLKKRQRWYRCLDAGYLSLKVFLLERFLHDILFESTTPRLLRDFVGDTSPSSVSK